MKRLLVKLALIFLTVTVLSVAIDAMYRNVYSLQYSWPSNIWIMPEISDKYKLVKLGNSHAQEGIVLDRYRVKSLSRASVAQSYEYDLANLKMYRRQIAEGAIILINVSPISFSQRTASREDSLQTAYYGGELSPFLIPRLKVEDYLESQIVPFYRAGFLWRRRIKQEIKDKTTKEEKLLFDLRAIKPVTILDKPGHMYSTEDVMKDKTFIPIIEAPPDYYYISAAINHELENPLQPPQNMLVESMHFIYNKWYNSDGFGEKYFTANRRQLEQLLVYCRKMKWRPVLISVPISMVLKNGLQPDFMEVNVYRNMRDTNLQGTEFLDFNDFDQVTKNSYLYNDSDHLNDKGAVIFSYLLLRRLIDKGYLPQDADGYDNTTKLKK